jgi:hypothetical protein
MLEWYYILGIISYGIFLLQFIVSCITGEIDVDLDMDFDGDYDFSINDLVSFKGLIHFLMGFSGFIMLCGKVNIPITIVAIVIGVVFVILLAIVYKMAMKLNHEYVPKAGIELIGTLATVYIIKPEPDSLHCICLLPTYQEINCIATEPVEIGDVRIIKGYTNGVYIIS